MDKHDLHPGEEWLIGIERGIRSANYFLACISPRSLRKEGVLAGELRDALEQWRKRRGDYRLIPVRLEDVEIPPSLKHLQWFDLFHDRDWNELAKAIRSERPLRRKWVYAAAAILSVLILGSVWWYHQRWPPGPMRVGVTLWRLRQPRPSDLPGSKMLVQPKPGGDSIASEWVPERASVGKPFAVGDHVRASFEAAQEGFLYIIDQESLNNGKFGGPKLIFPSRRIHGGQNHVRPGQLVEIPAQEDDPPYWDLQKQGVAYTGERLTIIFAPQPIAELAPGEDARDLDEFWFAAHLIDWKMPVTQVGSAAGAPATPTEIAAGKNGASGLASGDPLPQTIFSGTPKRGAPFLAAFPIQSSL